jgi:hypothetical protein
VEEMLKTRSSRETLYQNGTQAVLFLTSPIVAEMLLRGRK